jgi:hypothetical protein
MSNTTSQFKRQIRDGITERFWQDENGVKIAELFENCEEFAKKLAPA